MTSCNISKRYSLVVLAASFLTHVLTTSVPYVSGVLYVALTDRYPDSDIASSWIGSAYTCMVGLGAPVASLVVNLFDCRTCVFLSGLMCLVGYGCSSLVTDVHLLFISLSLVAGLGACFAYVGSITVLGFYFAENTPLAAGIVLAGTALGLFVHPSLTRYLVDKYGLPGTFLILAAMTSHSCVFGLLMRPTKLEKDKHNLKGPKKWAVAGNILCGSCLNAKTFLKNPTFSLFLVSIVFYGFAFAATLLYMPDYFKSRGATFEQASFSVSLEGLGSLVSRILTGFAANDKNIGGGILYPSIIGLMGIISAFITLFAESTSGMLTFGFLRGLYTGGVTALLSIRTFEIAGAQQFAQGFGLVFFAYGVGLLTGPPIAGAIYAATNVYTNALLFSTAMFFATTVFGFASIFFSRRHLQSQPNEQLAAVATISDSSQQNKEPGTSLDDQETYEQPNVSMETLDTTVDAIDDSPTSD